MAARFGKDWSPDCLFVMWSEEEFAPLSYSQALRRLRMLIEAFSGALAAESYTLHSAKCTFLSWMSERLLTPESRRLQGHHRSGSTQLYSRDDTWCALDAQQSLLSAIRQGWLPSTPIARGAQAPLRSDPVDLAVPDVPRDAGCPVPKPSVPRPVTMCESESEAEEGAARMEEVLGPPQDIAWLRSGQGAVHVAKPRDADSADSKAVRAACGAYLADPVYVAQPPSGAWLCQHRTCCKLRLGC